MTDRTDDPEWEKRKDWTLDQLANEVIDVCKLPMGCTGTLVSTLHDARRQGAAKAERENAVLRELLERFAEFERDADGYCDWCGTTRPKDHFGDCIYPEVRAALQPHPKRVDE